MILVTRKEEEKPNNNLVYASFATSSMPISNDALLDLALKLEIMFGYESANSIE